MSEREMWVMFWLQAVMIGVAAFLVTYVAMNPSGRLADAMAGCQAALALGVFAPNMLEINHRILTRRYRAMADVANEQARWYEGNPTGNGGAA